jgi:hypothetical protein
MYSKPVRLCDGTLDVDASRWPAGLYLFRLSDRGVTFASEKVMIK